jgi:hypothetical protein
MITIQIDGQTFPLPPEIAAKDELLKAALAPFVPWIANAQIDRKEENGATTVSVIKRADWKGSTGAVVSALITTCEEVNPAVALWLRLQDQFDLSDPGVVLALEPAINEAIASGENDIAAVRQSLMRLVECAAAPARRIPLGF